MRDSRSKPIDAVGRANRVVIRTLTVQRLVPLKRLLPLDVHFLLKALLLALVGVQLMRLIWLVLTPVGPLGNWRPAAPRVLSDEAQAVLLSTVDPFFRTSATPASPSPANLVDLQLFGTRAGGSGLPGSAVLGQSEGDQKSYLVGEEVAPGVKLSAVEFDHAVLERGGARQLLYMPGSEDSSAPTQASAPTAATPTIAEAFEMKPRESGGNVTGVAVGPGGNPTLFEAAGFRTGDVIVAVNGARISSLIDVQQLQSSLAPGARLTLTVERGAQSIPIALNIPVGR